MAIQKEIWTKFLVDTLFADNTFIQHAFNADEYVLQGKVVHIPVVGTKPTAKKNRTTLPATVSKRGDTDITYALDEFTTDPIVIPNADMIELSYDKISNVLSENAGTLAELAGDWILRAWAESTGNGTTTAQKLRTTGAAVAAHVDSATGNRKLFTKEDLKRAQTALNKKNIPKKDRFALLDSEILSQLQDDPDLKKRDVGQELDMKNGVITRLYGFDILERASVLRYTTAVNPKDPTSAGATSDHAAALCWQKNQVEKAQGTVDFFEDLDNPLYFGNLYSGLLRNGGRIRRADGVIAIVQDDEA